MLWPILAQFVFRLCLGLAIAMLLTSPRQVSSGFYRVHLWVLLGLATFGSLVVWSHDTVFASPRVLLGASLATAACSYIGSVIWLYDRVRSGMVTMVLVIITSAVAAWTATPHHSLPSSLPAGWYFVDLATSSLLLGTMFAAMLLGHWYLNSPSMKLEPLRRLLLLFFGSALARGLFCATSFWFGDQAFVPDQFFAAVLVLRWLSGILGTAGLGWMAWQTLRIPNTQSATGILYVGVVFSFLGELASQLLSINSAYPL